jgi:hypothetical protein
MTGALERETVAFKRPREITINILLSFVMSPWLLSLEKVFKSVHFSLVGVDDNASTQEGPALISGRHGSELMVTSAYSHIRTSTPLDH